MNRSIQQVKAPASAHQGWDMQFSRIAKYAAPRVMKVLNALANECLVRGFPVRIEHELTQSATASKMVVFSLANQPVLNLSITLTDGWELRQECGAMLSFDMRCLLTGYRIPMELYRFSNTFSCVPAEVFFNAGDHVDVDVLRTALADLL